MYGRSKGEWNQGCGMRVSAYGICRDGEPLSTERLLVEWEEKKSGISPLHLSSVKEEIEKTFLCLRAFTFFIRQQYGIATE